MAQGKTQFGGLTETRDAGEEEQALADKVGLHDTVLPNLFKII